MKFGLERTAALGAAILMMLSGCAEKDGSDIKIAVMGCDATYEDGYVNGIKFAIEDCRNKYPDYTFEAVFYEDEESYEKGSAITDEIISDGEYTAVIGSQTPTICESAAHYFEEEKLPMIATYTVYDSMLNENNYKNIFSMCYSSENVGKAMYKMMKEKIDARKIALCYCEDQSGKDEARGFASCVEHDIQIADIVKLHDLSTRFDEIYNRWVLLGVDTVIIMPYDTEGFDILRKLRDLNPDINVMGDFMFNNSDEIEKTGEAFDGFMMTDTFFNENEYGEIGERYTGKYGAPMTVWAMHGYDAVMMTAEAAVNSDNTAEYLHKNPYKSYSFDERGRLNGDKITYEVYNEGKFETYVLDIGEE